MIQPLPVPVVPTAARHGQGLDHLLEHIHQVASGEVVPEPRRAALDPDVEAAVDELVPELLKTVPDLPCPRWVALRLLEGDERLAEALRNGELANVIARRGEAAA